MAGVAGNGGQERGSLYDTQSRSQRSSTTACTAAVSSESDVSTTNELKNLGLKATLPRMKILEVFQGRRQRHMSAEDVYRELLADDHDIGLATVYRVLTQFEQAGLLKRSNFESGKAVYELEEGSHHDHLVCLQCGRVEEFFDEEIERRQRRVAEERGFALQEHALALYANCTKQDCPHRRRQGALPQRPEA
jgi:Fur family transcriptional regulator, ferric uptake regulator